MLSILPRRQLSTGYEHQAGYEHQYGLTRRPFSQALDQRFVYPYRSYATAVSEVRLGLRQREGLIVVTGGIGSGKTMLCRTLLRQLEAPAYVSVVFDPGLTVEELLLHILTDFGVVARQPLGGAVRGTSARRQLMTALQRFLASLATSGAYAVVVIDEAQQVPRAVLEQIRLLLNFETDEAKLLQIVLVGQPELDRVLRRPDMRRLDQRVARRCELQPLTAHEVAEYIERRLSVAQGLAVLDEPASGEGWVVETETIPCGVSFTPLAVRMIVARSQGIPRLVNLLCDRALEIGCHRRTRTIDARVVGAAARRLKIGNRTGTRRPVVSAAAAAMMAGVILVGGAWSWAWGPPAQPLTAPAPAFERADGPDPASWTLGTPTGELAVNDSFNINVASFKAALRASDVSAQLEASGLPAFVQTLAGGQWHRVIVGPYVSEADAAAAQDRLTSVGYPGTDIVIEHAKRTEEMREWRSHGHLVARVGVSQP